jgi:hypothetical protein
MILNRIQQSRAFLRCIALTGLYALQSSLSLAGPLISYPNFSSTAGLTLNGVPSSPIQVGSSLQMTKGGTSGQAMSGAAYVTVPQDITRDFHAVYQFTITNPSSFSGINGADGLAFVVQADPRGPLALGDRGTAVGYSEDTPPSGTAVIDSLAITLRTYTYNVFQVFENPAPGDIHFRTTSPALYTQQGTVSNILNQLQTVSVDYVEASHTITVHLDGNSIGLDNKPLTASLSSIVGSTSAYFGLTAATGSAISTITFNSFSVIPEPSTLALAALGFAALIAWRWRRR